MRKFSILVVFISSCIEPYDLEIRGTQRALVIEASLTNLAGEQFVQLEYSYALDGAIPEPASGAIIEVTDNEGNSEIFHEVRPGFYEPNSFFVGVVGRRYQLTVRTADGTEYQSEEEELLAPATSVNIYGEFLILRSETDGGFDRGIQFLVDIEGANEENHNYRFQYDESYEITVPFASLLEFDPSTRTINRRDPPIGLCYVSEQSRDLLIATTSGQTTSELREFPIVYVSEDEPNLIGDYSLTIRSYRISSAAYQYYKDLEENNESAGSFFDRQKGSLIGNIQNVGNVSEPVLGYFEVAAASEEFRLFDAGTWKEDGLRPGKTLQHCVDLLDTVQTIDILNGNINFNGRLIYNFGLSDNIVPGTTYSVITLLAPASCSDCRSYGSLEKPTLWD